MRLSSLIVKINNNLLSSTFCNCTFLISYSKHDNLLGDNSMPIMIVLQQIKKLGNIMRGLETN